MLDFARLTTPAEHGEVLVAPEPALCSAAARRNRELLDSADVSVAGVALPDLRRRTRRKLLGMDDRPVIAIGHQPEFIHAGVWAKHVVAHRLATALDGVAVNIVVDSDAPTHADLVIPHVKIRTPTARERSPSDRTSENAQTDQLDIELQLIRPAATYSGLAYEQFRPLSGDEIDAFEREARGAMNQRFDRSMLPAYFAGIRATDASRDWVDQTLAGRRAVENDLSIRVSDIRISEAWWSPLCVEILLNARRFALAYNAALADYRRAHKVRGTARPIPDLAVQDDRVELPFWASRDDQPRQRAFIRQHAAQCQLRTADEVFFKSGVKDILAAEDLVTQVKEAGGWRLRPRALVLTMWARLLLSDLFIHGIGGAKYDRITDDIIRRYFGIEPPQMACVSATMRLDLPHDPNISHTIRNQRRMLRDLTSNPQRYVSGTSAIGRLIEHRQALVEQSTALRDQNPADHLARRKVHRQTREANDRLLAARPELLATQRQRLLHAEQRLAATRPAAGREYFFALFGRAELLRLMAALPAERHFRV